MSQAEILRRVILNIAKPDNDNTAEAIEILEGIIADAKRYQYIREHQAWLRFETNCFVGVELKYKDDHTPAGSLDSCIDGRMKS